MPDEHTGSRIELADAVQVVRDQLILAASRASRASGQDVVFEVGDIELEFHVELQKQIQGGIKVKAWVVEAGADGGGSRTRTHRVAVTLKALDSRTGRPWKVRNENLGSVGKFGGSEDGR